MLERTLRSLSVVRFGSDICSVVHLIFLYGRSTYLIERWPLFNYLRGCLVPGDGMSERVFGY
jgi:hypothetical protein